MFVVHDMAYCAGFGDLKGHEHRTVSTEDCLAAWAARIELQILQWLETQAV